MFYDILFTKTNSSREVYASTSTDPKLLQTVSTHVQLKEMDASFVGTFAVIITWIDNGPGSEFQLLLVTDDNTTHAIHLYSRIDFPDSVLHVGFSNVNFTTFTTSSNIHSCFNGRFVYTNFPNIAAVKGM